MPKVNRWIEGKYRTEYYPHQDDDGKIIKLTWNERKYDIDFWDLIMTRNKIDRSIRRVQFLMRGNIPQKFIKSTRKDAEKHEKVKNRGQYKYANKRVKPANIVLDDTEEGEPWGWETGTLPSKVKHPEVVFVYYAINNVWRLFPNSAHSLLEKEFQEKDLNDELDTPTPLFAMDDASEPTYYVNFQERALLDKRNPKKVVSIRTIVCILPFEDEYTFDMTVPISQREAKHMDIKSDYTFVKEPPRIPGNAVILYDSSDIWIY